MRSPKTTAKQWERVRRHVPTTPAHGTSCASKVFNADTLQEVRLYVGFDYIGEAMFKTVGKKPMRDYDQNKKGYRADNRK